MDLRSMLHQALKALKAGDTNTAERLAREVVRVAPGVSVGHLVLGRALHEGGDPTQAGGALRQAVALDPRSAEGWSSLGVSLDALGRVDEPLRCLERALELAPRSVATLLRLGGVLISRGEVVDAEACFREAERLEAGRGVPGLVVALERQGRTEEAASLVDAHEGLLGTDSWFTISAVRVLLRAGRAADALAALDSLEPPTRPADVTAQEHARGDVLDALGEHEDAFLAHQRAHAARGLSFDPAVHRARIDWVISTWSEARLRAAPRPSVDASDLVFIVGMPRSGTTLVEQILASLSGVRSFGELDDLPQLARDVDLTDAFSVANASARYLARVRSDGSARRVIDKLPLNFLYLHTASVLFPGARVVHVRRDPLDTCVSCYFKDFAATLAWSGDLAALGSFYGDYARLMAHWDAVQPLPIHEVRYEELVARPEEVARGLVDFVGLEWDPACLRFHERGSIAKTASYAQVTQPIYTRSVGRASRYGAHLDPLRAALES